MHDTLHDQLRAAATAAARGRNALAPPRISSATLRARWVGIYSVTDDMVIKEAWSGPAPPAHPTFPVTQGLTGHAVRARALALSNDVGRDPRYLTNQSDAAPS